jgi:hypothetical protein
MSDTLFSPTVDQPAYGQNAPVAVPQQETGYSGLTAAAAQLQQAQLRATQLSQKAAVPSAAAAPVAPVVQPVQPATNQPLDHHRVVGRHANKMQGMQNAVTSIGNSVSQVMQKKQEQTQQQNVQTFEKLLKFQTGKEQAQQVMAANPPDAKGNTNAAYNAAKAAFDQNDKGMQTMLSDDKTAKMVGKAYQVDLMNPGETKTPENDALRMATQKQELAMRQQNYAQQKGNIGGPSAGTLTPQQQQQLAQQQQAQARQQQGAARVNAWTASQPVGQQANPIVEAQAKSAIEQAKQAQLLYQKELDVYKALKIEGLRTDSAQNVANIKGQYALQGIKNSGDIKQLLLNQHDSNEFHTRLAVVGAENAGRLNLQKQLESWKGSKDNPEYVKLQGEIIESTQKSMKGYADTITELEKLRDAAKSTEARDEISAQIGNLKQVLTTTIGTAKGNDNAPTKSDSNDKYVPGTKSLTSTETYDQILNDLYSPTSISPAATTF